jgi:hypothetical protein
MSKRKLTIAIIGQTNSGKSILLYELKELLKREGYDIKHILEGSDFDNEEQFDKHNSEKITKVDIKDMCSISIIEKNSNAITK